MENLLQRIERQRERKANRSVASGHNSSGSDVNDSGATFTVGALNTTQGVDNGRHTLGVEPLQGDLLGVSRLQPRDVDAANCTLNLDRIGHRVDEPVALRSETNSLWRKDDAPKVIPRKIASMPVSSYLSARKLVFTHKMSNTYARMHCFDVNCGLVVHIIYE